MTTGPAVPVAELDAECRVLEKVVLKHGWATEGELDAHRPGGVSNPDDSPSGWKKWFAFLHRRHARGERLPLARDVRDADHLVLNALAGEGVPVECAFPHPDGSPRIVKVYPKSWNTLTYLHGRDITLAWLTAKLLVLKERGGVAELELIDRVLAELTYQYGLIAWIVCTPGPGMPFDPEAEYRTSVDPNAPLNSPRPTIPAQFHSGMDVMDFWRIAQAHVYVNVQQLQALSHLLSYQPDPEKPSQRPAWSIILDNASEALEVPLPSMLRDWALVTVLAKVQLKAGAQEEARQKAAAQRKGA